MCNHKPVKETAAPRSQSVAILALQKIFFSFGRWWTEQSWRTGLLCMWGVKGQICVLFGPPISYRYSCTRDSLLAFRLKITPTINKQVSCLHWGPSDGCRRDSKYCDVFVAWEHGFGLSRVQEWRLCNVLADIIVSIFKVNETEDDSYSRRSPATERQTDRQTDIDFSSPLWLTLTKYVAQLSSSKVW